LGELEELDELDRGKAGDDVGLVLFVEFSCYSTNGGVNEFSS